jgi:hypothetical protein
MNTVPDVFKWNVFYWSYFVAQKSFCSDWDFIKMLTKSYDQIWHSSGTFIASKITTLNCKSKIWCLSYLTVKSLFQAVWKF